MFKLKIHLFVILLSLLVLSNSTCPEHCTNCANSTSCSTCAAGFFLVNGTFCPPCPMGCSACTLGADGRPSCTNCTAPAQLGSAGQCFLCDPSCQTCRNVPKNCTACPDGRMLLPGINGTMICGQNPNCTIPNCG